MSERGRILSHPVRVEWAGWRTDTLSLQQAGWEIAVDFDPNRQMYRLLLRHQLMNLYALSDSRVIHRKRQFETTPDFPVFRVSVVSPRIEVHRFEAPRMYGPSSSFENFQQIDAEPVYTERRIESIEDFNIFNVPLTRAEQIVVDKADMTVIEHLEAIRKLQAPKQRELRDAALRYKRGSTGGAAPRMDVIANVVSLAEAA